MEFTLENIQTLTKKSETTIKQLMEKKKEYTVEEYINEVKKKIEKKAKVGVNRLIFLTGDNPIRDDIFKYFSDLGFTCKLLGKNTSIEIKW